LVRAKSAEPAIESRADETEATFHAAIYQVGFFPPPKFLETEAAVMAVAQKSIGKDTERAVEFCHFVANLPDGRLSSIEVETSFSWKVGN
jgi:hypothetical protein